MLSIFKKEISSFFSSLIGYIVIGVFLIVIGLITWVFPDTSILTYNYAGLDPLFSFAPLVFLFLIPAITMRSFSEEFQHGTMEFLSTKPITDVQLLGGKFLANFCLVMLALIPTFIYYFSVYQLGSPKGNLDSGGILGSYIGLSLLSAAFVSIGIFASTLTRNQVVAFVLAVLCCVMMYSLFSILSELPIFVGSWDEMISKVGMSYHYKSLSRGLLDTRDIIYFLTVIFFFLYLTKYSLSIYRS